MHYPFFFFFFESPMLIKGAWKNKVLIVLNPLCLEKYFLPFLYDALILCNVWRIPPILWKTWCSSHLNHPSVWKRAGHNHSVQQWLQTAQQKALMWEWRSQWGKLKILGQEAKPESFLIFSRWEAGLYLLLVEHDPRIKTDKQSHLFLLLKLWTCAGKKTLNLSASGTRSLRWGSPHTTGVGINPEW